MRTRFLRALLAVSLVFIPVGCTKQPALGSASGPAYSPPAKPPSPEPQLMIQGVDADVTTFMRALYKGEKVESSGTGVPEALAQRKAPAKKPLTGVGTLGTWKGTKVASVAVGDDVTLLARGATTWRAVGGWWPSLQVSQKVPTGKRFVLAVGSDARPGEDRDRSRSDALQIMGYDGGASGGVLGIARDSWVPIDGSPNKINNALVFGGPDLLVDTVKQISGLPIEGYLIADFDGLVGTIEGVGGLQVNFPHGLPSALEIPPGPRTIDGNTTLAAARERYHLPQGDFDRSFNQGLLLGFAAIQLKDRGPAKLAASMDPLSQWLGTNLNAEQALTFFSAAFRVEIKNIGHDVCKGETATIGGAEVVMPGSRETDLYAKFSGGALPA